MKDKVEGGLISARTCWWIVGYWSLLIAIGIALRAPYSWPYFEGESATFWDVAVLVDITPYNDQDDRGFSGGAEFKDDKWAVYEDGGMHGTLMYRVPIEDALADFDAVVTAVKEGAENEERADHFTGKAYKDWLAIDEAERTPEALVAQMKQAKLDAWLDDRSPGMIEFSLWIDDEFDKRWDRVGHFWFNIVFEWAHLSGLALFALWPLIKGWRPWVFGAYVACLPLLVMLPAYLGYATQSLLAGNHPRTAVVYPLPLNIVDGVGGDIVSMNRVDVWLLKRTPQLLEGTAGLTEGLGTLFFAGSFGPTGAVVVGVPVGVTAWLMLHVLIRINRWDKSDGDDDREASTSDYRIESN